MVDVGFGLASFVVSKESTDVVAGDTAILVVVADAHWWWHVNVDGEELGVGATRFLEADDQERVSARLEPRDGATPFGAIKARGLIGEEVCERDRVGYVGRVQDHVRADHGFVGGRDADGKLSRALRQEAGIDDADQWREAVHVYCLSELAEEWRVIHVALAEGNSRDVIDAFGEERGVDGLAVVASGIDVSLVGERLVSGEELLVAGDDGIGEVDIDESVAIEVLEALVDAEEGVVVGVGVGAGAKVAIGSGEDDVEGVGLNYWESGEAATGVCGARGVEGESGSGVGGDGAGNVGEGESAAGDCGCEDDEAAVMGYAIEVLIAWDADGDVATGADGDDGIDFVVGINIAAGSVAGVLDEASALGEVGGNGAGVEGSDGVACVGAAARNQDVAGVDAAAGVGSAVEDEDEIICEARVHFATTEPVAELHEVGDDGVEIIVGGVEAEGDGDAFAWIEGGAGASDATSVVVDFGLSWAHDEVAVHEPALPIVVGNAWKRVAVAVGAVVVAEDVVDAKGAVVKAVVGSVDVGVEHPIPVGGIADDVAKIACAGEVEAVAVAEGVAGAARGATVGLADISIKAEIVAIDALAEGEGSNQAAIRGEEAVADNSVIEIVIEPAWHVLDGVDAEAVDFLNVEHPLGPPDEIIVGVFEADVAVKRIGLVEAAKGGDGWAFVACRDVAGEGAVRRGS